MEVIQNADDTQYPPGTTPTIRISVAKQRVKIECNEVGFTEQHIEALCRAGRSSKPLGQGYIGEKGIGFKSVFKIAKRAHIRSPPFYFQLDQTRELGMVTPLWDEDYFNSPVEYQTTIVLDQICDTSTDFSATLEQDLRTLDPVVILFLRRIKRLYLTRYDSDHFSPDRLAFSKYFRVDDGAFDNVVTLVDEGSGARSPYYKWDFPNVWTGSEPRRPGLVSNQIVLSFPVERSRDSWLARPRELLTFAYLPVGSFGFKFIIQADFLTTSNRQSVDEDNRWNINIANAIPRAFAGAVRHFNERHSSPTGLGKTWPLFLNSAYHSQSRYWRNIHEGILNELRSSHILQTCSGSYAFPSSLAFMDWACDSNGEPMFGQKQDYVSADYPQSVRPTLRTLNVKVPDWQWVIGHARNLIVAGCTWQWFSDLAKVLLAPPEARSGTSYTRELCRINLVPLADNSWTTAPNPRNPVYFPQSSGVSIPSGLPLTLVHNGVCEYPHTMSLLRLLGVRDCSVSDVVERIFDYHDNFSIADRQDMIGHVKYLFHARDHLGNNSMDRIRFAPEDIGRNWLFRRSWDMYIPDLPDSNLRELFSSYEGVFFLHAEYFQGLTSSEKADFTRWLSSVTSLATIPRLSLTTNGLSQMHGDFRWLMDNKGSEIIGLLRKHWRKYQPQANLSIRGDLERHIVSCTNGSRLPLRETFLPHPALMEKSLDYCGRATCPFLSLAGPCNDWMFLSQLGVGSEEDLDFFLWVLRQDAFRSRATVQSAKRLYLEIQSRAEYQRNKVNAAFQRDVIATPSGNFVSASNCVYHAPHAYSSKPSLFSIYGSDLTDLFQRVLDIRSATEHEVFELLQQLRSDPSTTMLTVANVYMYLQSYGTQSTVHNHFCLSLSIAVPSDSGSLTWKLPFQCVWGDHEFSQNGLHLRSRISLQHIMERYLSDAVSFFTGILRIPNAGIDDLLGDLRLLQQEHSDDASTIFRLYERITAHCRSSRNEIRAAFTTSPLVFLRGSSGSRGQWLQLNECIWNRSNLRSKHALSRTLSQYQTLFRETLDVPNVTLEMLVAELCIITALGDNAASNEDQFQYGKRILRDINGNEDVFNSNDRLRRAKCWPCLTSAGRRTYLGIGEFYVNDRQDVFEIFSHSRSFLDFDFDGSRNFVPLLRHLGCDLFLSEKVTVGTEACEPLQLDEGLGQGYRRRADALCKYLEYKNVNSPYDLRILLENSTVWLTHNIITHYSLGTPGQSEYVEATKDEGGSSVRVSETARSQWSLEIYLSSNRNRRNCAMVTDFPRQLAIALGISLINIDNELHHFLDVPVESLEELLIKKGAVGGPSSASNQAEISEAREAARETEGLQQTENALFTPSSLGPDTPLTDSRAESEATLATRAPSGSLAPQPAPFPRELLSDQPVQLGGQLSSGEITYAQPTPDNQARGPSVRAGIYHFGNRSQNRDRLEHFAQAADVATNARAYVATQPTNGSHDGRSNARQDAFDVTDLRAALEDQPFRAHNTTSNVTGVNGARDGSPTIVAPRASVVTQETPVRRLRWVPDRNSDERARDFEVGFLGEQFVYTLLHDRLSLPNFSGDINWTSTLRTRAGFSAFGREISDFTYRDTEGALTRYMQQMRHPYPTPAWLNTACDNGNAPLYRLEVKSTTSQDPTTQFYMSGNQYALARRLQVTSAVPSEIYAVIRVSGLDALEEGAQHQPEWMVYLDPYSRSEEGILDFFAQTYTVTPQR
ncbi:hypothetical protein NA57DRAFT_51704 [Rhizodiscina lignyota]|uniref:Protein NO VEIN C-terminal domain-containing protein n=1 Tax=Rhizodiscina lignyota TaxID=1504668 RepID=A0A9P4IUY8_9PEZI|nr:hypothetical protein NA57DRAFT_51704 [Rhizodiscina lignyota]